MVTGRRFFIAAPPVPKGGRAVFLGRKRRQDKRGMGNKAAERVTKRRRDERGNGQEKG